MGEPVAKGIGMRGRVNQDSGDRDGRKLTGKSTSLLCGPSSQLGDDQGGRASWQVELENVSNMSDDLSDTDVDVLTADAAKRGRWHGIFERRSVLDRHERQHARL